MGGMVKRDNLGQRGGERIKGIEKMCDIIYRYPSRNISKFLIK